MPVCESVCERARVHGERLYWMIRDLLCMCELDEEANSD